MSLKIRRGTDAERLLITPEEGELIYTTDTKELYVGDGETPGGNLTSDNNAGTVTSVTGTGTIAGIALSGTVTTSGNLTLGGTLAVPITNITATGTKDSTTFLRGDGSWAAPVSGSTLPTQTGNSGKVLTTDGTNLSWTTNGNGTVTSVTGTGTVAGISLSGTVNSAGSLTLGGTLAVPIGNITATGTSDSTTFLRGDGSWAIPVSGSLLPTQIGNNGKVLTTDGTSLIRITPPMGGTLTSNLDLSTFSITGGGNLNISSSKITLETSEILSTANGLNIKNGTTGSLIFSNGVVPGTLARFEGLRTQNIIVRQVRGTLDAPTNALAGDTAGNLSFAVYYDGADKIISRFISVIDNNADLTVRYPKSSVAIITGGNSNVSGVYNSFIFGPDASFSTNILKLNKFNDASSRDTNIPTPTEGMIIFLKDDGTTTPRFQGYNGSSWVNLN